MRRYRPTLHLLAIGLALLAGFLDALAFLTFGGTFVSFMSGNSAQAGIDVVADRHAALPTLALVASFVVGVMAGALVGRQAGRWRKQAVLALVVAVLLVAATLATLGADAWLPLLLAGASGAANDVFQRDGEVSIGVTYMTGTLVKLGQHLAQALVGGSRRAWLPYLLLWAGFVAGAAAGATAYSRLGLPALWVAVGCAALLLAGTMRLGPQRVDGHR